MGCPLSTSSNGEVVKQNFNIVNLPGKRNSLQKAKFVSSSSDNCRRSRTNSKSISIESTSRRNSKTHTKKRIVLSTNIAGNESINSDSLLIHNNLDLLKEKNDGPKPKFTNSLNVALTALKSVLLFKRRDSPPSRHPSITSSYSAMSLLSPKQELLSYSGLLKGYSIDMSRAKSNGQVVSMCCRKMGMIEYSDGVNEHCDIYWHNIVYNDMKTIIKNPEARVNKFPGMTELAKKVSLTQAIRSMKELFPWEYEFYPQSFVLPAQLDEFRQQSEQMNATGQKQYYIVKPDDGAQGTGIYLIKSSNELRSTSEKQLVQEYLSDPYLMKDRLKFDFRVYALIKSLNPLSIYVAREGMARFCTEPYVKPTPSNFSNLYAHLTNYSLNKANGTYIHSKSLKDQLQGSKRLLSTVLHQMEWEGLRTRRLWHEIKMVLAMVPEIMLNYEHYFCDVSGPQCFQIMGFDIIVRRDGVPFLLEVNSAPSLSVEHTELSENGELINVRSIMIKVPLVTESILLVLNKLDDAYKLFAKQNGGNTALHERRLVRGSISSNAPSIGEPDVKLQDRVKRKPHLSEIFPGRYGHTSKHLLVLDRAVYLFMQFVNLKQSLHISLMGIKAFIKKCNLKEFFPLSQLEERISNINNYFSKSTSSPSTGLPFHGFLHLLFHIAKLKFPFCSDILPALLRLLAYCDSSLRYYGVRSTRLRRAELEHNENSSQVEIYLLPDRIRKLLVDNTKGRGTNRIGPTASQERLPGAKRKVSKPRSRSLPRSIHVSKKNN
ncbi:tubulin-tyrosine ligase family domain-containing protein [Ditylenchus destructor]|uniref:Tubulin-tyrosine ligase family domain-containing protein n=1 Tax=Ditylenchus destructor TaxID=166010 RepID=A0AAD4MUH2_9BILA|nr:tubulin-tyrosine ligase family domain-containing protein [Ditylenchus destructor]